jgi:hypothetical protein
MRLTSKPLGLIILAIFVGGISFSTWMGWWQTQSTKEPVKYSEGEFVGSYNPADIRGSYTFGDINRVFEIPLTDLAKAFLLPEGDQANRKVSELEAIYLTAAENGMEIGTGSVRLFVAYYLDLPFNTNEEFLPAPAVGILKNRNNLTLDQITYLESHSVPLEFLGQDTQSETSTIEEPAVIATTVPEEHSEEEDKTIKGKTTFQEVLDWGVSQEDIEIVLGVEMPNPLNKIKDFCLEQGLEFNTIKTSLQALIPKP